MLLKPVKRSNYAKWFGETQTHQVRLELRPKLDKWDVCFLDNRYIRDHNWYMRLKSERLNTMLEAIIFILNTFAKDEVQIQDRFSPEVTTYNAKEIEMKKTDQVFGYKVTIEGTCTVDEWDGEQYGSWHKESDQSIKDLVEKVEEYPDVISTLDIPSGGNALVVWVVWSSGDSFGNHSGGYAEAVGIFTDINAARELQKHIDSIDWQKTHELNFKTSDGQHFDIGFCGWAGYFEHVDSVNLDVVKVF